MKRGRDTMVGGDHGGRSGGGGGGVCMGDMDGGGQEAWITSPCHPLSHPRWSLTHCDLGSSRTLSVAVDLDTLAICGLHMCDKSLSLMPDLWLSSVKSTSSGGFSSLVATHLSDPTLGVVQPHWLPPTPAAKAVSERLLDTLSMELQGPVLGGLVSAGWGVVANAEASALRASLKTIQHSWNNSPYNVLKLPHYHHCEPSASWGGVSALLGSQKGLGAGVNILLPRGATVCHRAGGGGSGSGSGSGSGAGALPSMYPSSTLPPPSWTPLQTAAMRLLGKTTFTLEPCGGGGVGGGVGLPPSGGKPSLDYFPSPFGKETLTSASSSSTSSSSSFSSSSYSTSAAPASAYFATATGAAASSAFPPIITPQMAGSFGGGGLYSSSASGSGEGLFKLGMEE